MGIQEGAAPTPSAPLQAGHARFWQRPSHISHRDSPGLRSPLSTGRERARAQESEEMGRLRTLPSAAPASGAIGVPARPGPAEGSGAAGRPR